MLGTSFSTDGNNNDGETIEFKGEVTDGTVTIPGERIWYYNDSGDYLATDNITALRQQRITENIDPGKNIWIDADVAIGTGNEMDGYNDVDDAFALVQLLKHPEFNIQGISTVFGNTDIDNAFRLASEIVKANSSASISVYKGAAGPMDKAAIKENVATQAMADALSKGKMSILAIGPATNVGTLLALHPTLADSILSVILVAGRRTANDHFLVGPYHDTPFPDLNFELDPTAFQFLLQSQVPVVLHPFEISHKVWITQSDIEQLAKKNDAGKYLADNTTNWLSFWDQLGADGFNPFDLLASTWLMDPSTCKCEDLPVDIQLYPDDRSKAKQVFKPYLIVSPALKSSRKVRYCWDVTSEKKGWILDFMF